ncbi:DUF5395 family protein [Planctomycetota bacterium]
MSISSTDGGLIELRLYHDGSFWVAENDSLSARGRTLPELDEAIGRTLKRDRAPSAEERVSVRMSFDNASIPQWIRQYSNHYFNRQVSLDLRDS